MSMASLRLPVFLIYLFMDHTQVLSVLLCSQNYLGLCVAQYGMLGMESWSPAELSGFMPILSFQGAPVLCLQ